ncbi:phage shock protein operon transcriptional activator [Neptunomonas concharum]|uniref:Phage shock protein operon transcriptional activator n=1 Tax=Neptunomonas concharum TaxID=1031538 RepID=A0A5P1R942_9GAMM|nr:phage shock protein operon transcriptional activator [Neptunomonas concharum]QEQ96169.1 phage shock protein operon transcriptional activator [Neptunomonas concharum]
MKLSYNKAMIGESPLMLDLMDQVSRIAPLHKPVLIIGERGTGKELIAERLHFLSKRWDQAFLKVNCASMNDNLLESDLFGHEAGAFTGATRRHIGRFERAEAGTLFLDELATCSQQVQEKLLRIVEYGEYERVGGQQTMQADVRLIAATNADLPELAEKEEFRADLLDRLAFDVLHIPPLRYRQEDVLLLAEHFALSMCFELERRFFPGFAEQARLQMLEYDWPGNVRELRNAVERSVYRQEDVESPIRQLIIDPFASPWESPVAQKDQDLEQQVLLVGALSNNKVEHLSDRVEALEKRLLLEALEENHYNQKEAAKKLGLTYHQLRAQLRKHNMIPLKKFLEGQQQENASGF